MKLSGILQSPMLLRMQPGLAKIEHVSSRIIQMPLHPPFGLTALPSPAYTCRELSCNWKENIQERGEGQEYPRSIFLGTMAVLSSVPAIAEKRSRIRGRRCNEWRSALAMCKQLGPNLHDSAL